MITLHTWATQNARKISVMLEECGFDYQINFVDITKGEQFSASFTALNPNNKIPVLVDTNTPSGTVTLFETGSILLYLAEKSGCFLSADPVQRAQTISWLFWQSSAMGPAFGNFSHFASAMARDRSLLNAYLAQTGAPEPVHYAIERFTKESFRLLSVLNNVLKDSEFIAGDISIADFAAYPWVESAWPGFCAINPNLADDYRHVARWMADLAARDGVKRGMKKLAWGVEAGVK